MQFDAATLKRPWVKYSLYGVAGIGAIYIAYKYVGGGTAVQGIAQSNPGIDPALVALQQQQNQLSASSAAAASTMSYNLALNFQQNQEKLKEVELVSHASAVQEANKINGALSLASLQGHTSLEIAATNAQVATNLATINSNNVISNLNSTVALGTAETQAQIALAGINATTSRENAATAASTITTLAGITAAQEQAAIDAQVKLGTIVSDNQTAVALDQINSQTNVAITQSNNQLAATTTQSNNQKDVANTATHGSTATNIIKGVATVAAAFFSDQRLKKNIKRIGAHNCGCGLYEYSYIWENETRIGVIAQEVLEFKPEAVTVDTESGFYKVDYSILNG